MSQCILYGSLAFSERGTYFSLEPYLTDFAWLPRLIRLQKVLIGVAERGKNPNSHWVEDDGTTTQKGG
jgi:hypothetical protein